MPGLRRPLGEAGVSAAGFAAGLGADFAAGLAADSDFAAGLAPGFAAGLAAGAPGLAAAFPGFAAGFLVESPPALPPAGAESANASFTRRTTGLRASRRRTKRIRPCP